MRTLRRLIFGEVINSVAFVSLGFLALFFFFDFVDEIRWVRSGESGRYGLTQALLYVALLMPARLYELLPITVLIGTVVVMARFAQSSEFTILRTSGLGPWRALGKLLTLGLGFVVVTFAIGDYLAPAADRYGQLVRSGLPAGKPLQGLTGGWLKENQNGQRFAVNINRLTPEGGLQGVRIFEFDTRGFMTSIIEAPKARIDANNLWQLEEAFVTRFEQPAGQPERVHRVILPTFSWQSTITAEMVSVALLKPERMRTLDLFQYIRHLNANGQTAQKYEIEFWRKVFYPLSCLVMVMLALPFAYLHFRAGGISTYVFTGVMIGISFFLLNNLFGYAGNLQNWSPWLTSAAPGLIYMLVSLAAFGWLVLRR